MSGAAFLRFVLSTVLLLASISQAYSQICIQCSGTEMTGTLPSRVGGNIKVDGDYSFSGGYYSEVNGSLSFAFGNRAMVTGSHSAGIGMFVRTMGTNVMVLGSGFTINDPLINNIDQSLMIGFGSTKPTLFVGPSTGVSNTGRIGIGNVTAPQAKLHIRADANEPATLRLEATGNSGDNIYSRVLFTSNHSIQAANNQNFTFSTQSTKHFVFQNGNVGIGTNDPSSILHIHQSEEPVLKLSNDQGNLIVAVVNTPSHYAPTSLAGDVVFKTHYSGDRHGMIFNMNDAFNDGNSYIKFNDNLNHNTLTILNNGKVGIGTNNPEASLEVNGDVYVKEGNMGIGTNATNGYKLAVAGKIIAEEMRIVHTVPESDYVFNPDYPLMPLNELQAFITANNHLPEVPSADAFKENGYSIGTMDDLLLRKIEELTLYILQQQKEIESLKIIVNSRH